MANTQAEYYCYICRRDLVLSNAMSQHNLDKHGNITVEGVTVACDLCGTLCPTETDLLEHKKTEHKEGWIPHRNEKKVKKSKKEKAYEKKKAQEKKNEE